jgi:O-antigen/teichoic acid export membrane protein
MREDDQAVPEPSGFVGDNDHRAVSTPPLVTDPLQPPIARGPSLSRNTLARFAADGIALVLGMIAGIITARSLGPAGKGTFSALTFLLTLGVGIASLGLGDSVIVLTGRGSATLRRATSSTISVLLITSVLGALACFAIGTMQVDLASSEVEVTILLTALVLPIGTFANVLNTVLSARERILLSSLILVVASIVTTGAIFLFVTLMDLGVLGGIMGVAAGNLASLVGVLRPLSRMGVTFRPAWEASYLRAALRHGILVQSAALLMTLGGRFDLLLVYSLAGRADAGQYSVALTIGQLVVYAPFALSLATYPRIAQLPESEVVPLVTKLSRASLVTAVGSAILLCVASPFLIPFLFGNAYRPAIQPALILIAGGVLTAEQWVLCRAAAARGKNMVLFGSFALSVITMVVLDFALIPSMGIIGAALASVVSPMVGLAYGFIAYRRSVFPLTRARDLLPRPGDVRQVLASAVVGAREMMRRIRGS